VPERLELAARFGATRTVDVRDAGELARLRSAARRDGFDWAIVTVGREDAVRLGVELTRPGAATVVVGLLPESSPVPVDMLDLVTYEKRIVGSAYGTTSPRVLVPRIVQLYLDGSLQLDELVTDRLPLAAIDDAFELSRRASGLRPVLQMAE
jgi:S-(hydroxymethyl)glutathione dehydrogenase / alcohol dehydrogenase